MVADFTFRDIPYLIDPVFKVHRTARDVVDWREKSWKGIFPDDLDGEGTSDKNRRLMLMRITIEMPR